jgi:ribosome-associated protein
MKQLKSRELVTACCRALAEKKAEDLRVLDVSAQSSITDYLILATGTSEPQLRALRVELTKALAETHTRLVGAEISQESGWTVIDAFDVMIHLFTPEQRDRYSLDSLWKDAQEVPVDELLNPDRKAAVKRPAAKRKAAKPKAKAKAKGAKPKAKAKPAKAVKKRKG